MRNSSRIDKNQALSAAIKKWELEEINDWLSQGADPNAITQYTFDEVTHSLGYYHKKDRCFFSGTKKTSILQLAIDVTYYQAIPEFKWGEKIDLSKFNFEIIEALLNHNVNLNKLLPDGSTILHHISGHPDNIYNRMQYRLLKMFCLRGADLSIRDDEGMTALEIAISYDDEDKVDILLQYRANPNLKNSDGQTALHCAAKHGNFSIIKKLINYGADKTIADVDGKLPVDYAAAPVIAKLLNTREQYASIGSLMSFFYQPSKEIESESVNPKTENGNCLIM